MGCDFGQGSSFQHIPRRELAEISQPMELYTASVPTAGWTMELNTVLI